MELSFAGMNTCWLNPRVRAPRSVCSNSANRLNQHFTHGMPQILSSDLSSLPECNRLHQVIVRNTSKNIHPRSGRLFMRKAWPARPRACGLFALGVPTYFAQTPIATTMPAQAIITVNASGTLNVAWHSGIQQIRDGTS